MQGLMKVHGKSISQKDFRDRINYVKRKSNWKDADFQTWRLILKRVLSNSAESLDDLSEVKKEGSLKYFNLIIIQKKGHENRLAYGGQN